MAPDALILDGHLKSALAAARSLAHHHVRVTCGASRSTAPTLHSNACDETFRYPDPLTDLNGFLNALRAAARGRTMVLFTFSDRTTLAVSRNRDQLPPNIRILLPSAQQVEFCFNKERLMFTARNLSIPVPDTLTDTTLADLDRFGSRVIIKPRFNCFWSGGQGRAARVVVAHDRSTAIRAFKELHRHTGEPPLLQRHVPGSEFGITVLCREGTVLAACAHRRLRSLSPDGGASVLKETIPLPDGPYIAAVRILKHLQWTGPAMVEFRGDPQGDFFLIEVNGRFWGSLPLQVAAGLDFPFLAIQLAANQEIGEHRARVGVISRYLLGDVGWLVRSLARGRFVAIPRFLRAFSPRIHTDVWNTSDPAPFFWDLVYTLTGRL